MGLNGQEHLHIDFVDLCLGAFVNDTSTSKKIAYRAENDDFKDRLGGDFDQSPDGGAS